MDLGYTEHLWLQECLPEAGVKHVNTLLALGFPEDSQLGYFSPSTRVFYTEWRKWSMGSDSRDVLILLSVHFQGTVLLLMGRTKLSETWKEKAEGSCCWGAHSLQVGTLASNGPRSLRAGKTCPGHVGPPQYPYLFHQEAIQKQVLWPDTLIPGSTSPKHVPS